MKPEDRDLLDLRVFGRDDWEKLWDRLPTLRTKKMAFTFLFHVLHSIESGGQLSMRWHYVTNAEREESVDPIPGDPNAKYDQPGDVITLEGTVTIGPD